MQKQPAKSDIKRRTLRKVPRGARRRLELAEVAERTFLEHGFSDTTMQMIASRAGGSKETLYRHFANKEALFAEIVGRRAMAVTGPESALARDGAPEAVLLELGVNLLTLMATTDSLSLFRLVVAEAPRAPELAAVFYAQGPAVTIGRLTDYLRAAPRRGELDCREPLLAAKLFVGAVVSHHHLRCLIGQPVAPLSPANIRKHVRAAVRMFLERYGV